MNSAPHRERDLCVGLALLEGAWGERRLRHPFRVHVTFDGVPLVPFDHQEDDCFWGLEGWTLTSGLGRNRGNAAALADLAAQVRDTDDWVVVSHGKTWLSDYSLIDRLVDIPRYAEYDDEWDCVLLDEGEGGILENPTFHGVCIHLMVFRASCFRSLFFGWEPYPAGGDCGEDAWIEFLVHRRISDARLRVHRLRSETARWGGNTVVLGVDGTDCAVLSSNDSGDRQRVLQERFGEEERRAVEYAQRAWDEEVERRRAR